MKITPALSAISLSLLLVQLALTANACTIVSHDPDLPADRLEAYKKAQAIIKGESTEKGTRKYYQALFDASKYIYVGRVTLILDKSDRADEAKKNDATYAYVKISKGWKSGKVRNVRLRLPKVKPLCDQRFSYQLKEKISYLFFENRRELITALPINKNTKADRFAAQAIKQYGQSDWYYSRNTTIHYNSQ